MVSEQPIVLSAGDKSRAFATSATALQAIIINDEEQFLLLSSPTRNQENGWQVVSGALEAGETILDGVLREVKEEVGEEVRARPLGVVHVETFHYDEKVRYMIGVHYLLAYQGGQVLPGDDMAGSQFHWWDLDKLADERLIFHPSTKPWMLRRAKELFRLWKNEDAPLQPNLENPSAPDNLQFV